MNGINSGLTEDTLRESQLTTLLREDTCVAGPNFDIIQYTGEHCDVTPYSDEYKPITDVPIVNASTAYTDPETGITLIQQFDQVLWYGKKMQWV